MHSRALVGVVVLAAAVAREVDLAQAAGTPSSGLSWDHHILKSGNDSTSWKSRRAIGRRGRW